MNIVLYVVLFLISLVCFFHGQKLSALYLSISLIAQLVCQLFKYLLIGVSVPYMGFPMFIFVISLAGYLLSPVALMYILGLSFKSETLKQVSLTSYGMMIVGILICYPFVSGIELLLFFNCFYLVILLPTFAYVISIITKRKISIDEAILSLAALGTICQILIQLLFQLWWLNYVALSIFYMVVLLVNYLPPRYRNSMIPSGPLKY